MNTNDIVTALQNLGSAMQNFGVDSESVANEVQRTAEIANKNIDYENEILCIKCNPSLNFFQKHKLIKQLKKQQRILQNKRRERRC